MTPDADYQAEQRWLGVGVPLQRRPHAHLKYLDRIEDGARALALGFREPERGHATRIARLRQRLKASPFYADWLRSHGLSADDLQNIADLPHFPVLPRDHLGARWGDAGAFGLDPMAEADLVIATSSGSSGKATPVLRDGYDQLHMWAAIRFWRERLEVELPPRPRLAFLCALPGGLEYSTRLPHMENGALHRISTLRPDAARRLERIKPSLLSSDPAGLHWLMNQEHSLAPRMVLSSAQHLGPAQRAVFESRLRAPLINTYATTETGPLAWECLLEPGAFHALQPDVYLESVEGEVVVTRLRDSVLPLLRYQTGDAGAVVEGRCPCGFVGRSIRGFLGRRACHFVRSDGARVDAWNLIWLFKDLPLVGFRMEQRSPEHFDVQVDALLPMAPELFSQRLEVALKRLGWASPAVTVRRVETLPPLAKPEPFLCRGVVPSSAGRSPPASRLSMETSAG